MTSELHDVTDEYGTYAPKGAACLLCQREIKPTERARRGYLTPEGGGKRGDMNPVYHHAQKCPPV
ncbi:hypothetical protein GCM10017562_21380 [Streptomyces roseofulvus]|uniref:hypothetical protein n=1 Tax=Streptomyces roseofulvus TaxID=33902 RepID=UPI0031F87EE6